MTVSKNYEGAWVISDIVDGYMVKRRYYGYTMREAVRMFRETVYA